MKHFLLIVLTIVSLMSCSNRKQPQRSSDGKILKNGQFYDSQEAETGMVWICMGRKSHAYHSTEECYGIKACRGRKRKVSLSEARSMGRTPCHYCHKEPDEAEAKDPHDPDTYDPMNAWTYGEDEREE